MANKKVILHPADDNVSELYPKTVVSCVDGLSTALSGKQDTLVSGTNIKTINNNSILGSGNITIDSASITEITYADLVSARTNSTLKVGTWYRITDYRTYATGSSITCANHDFDLLVFATKVNELSEQAKATLHSGDTYFSGCKLNAWQVWYCLDNDSNRFGWADTTNGKGVIYRLIDEFNNDVPYDFKNILYGGNFVFTYTEDNTKKDASLLASKNCYNNIMKPYFSSNIQTLNNNRFVSNDTTFNCYGNTFEEDCRLNTFGKACSFNMLKNNCVTNSFGNSCGSNTIGNNCNSNTFNTSCGHNTFGNGCSDNFLRNYCYYHSFGNYCRSNRFESSCSYNLFGNNCSDNHFAQECNNNTFGNSCSNNTFGNSCKSNTFGNNCKYIYFGTSPNTIDYCQNIIIDNGCSYISLYSTDTTASSSNQLQNIHIHLGVTGSSTSNMLNIEVPDRALEYSTDYYVNNSTEVYL